ncbi:RNA polymerase II transcriptional coactivator KIWI [Cucurbita argyrosperma subsp. argyrosperma]|nr:RNA polymerase II transcriptional coactivator KIWI [Cucurbita argyrosperma subsp. argyrosperma]
MSARGKRKDDEDHVSEGDAPPKKTFRKDSDETDEIVVCEISKNRRVMVRNWQGKIVVDIREFYVKDGKQMPGKKGSSHHRLLFSLRTSPVFRFSCSG